MTFEPSAARIAVAVIDDNAYTRGLVAEALRLVGATSLVGFRSPVDAIDHFRAFTPRVIIVQSTMPDMDGLTFSRRLRSGAFPVPRDTPIVLMASQFRGKDVEAARAAGIDAFITRPFSAKTLGDYVFALADVKRTFVDKDAYVGPCRRRLVSPDYGGPLRRESDDARAVAVRDSFTTATLKVVASARSINNTVNANALARARQLEQIGRSLLATARKLNDGPLSTAAASLIQYLERRPFRNHYDRTIVHSHIDVLQSLMLVRDNEALRGEVASELIRQVERRHGGHGLHSARI